MLKMIYLLSRYEANESTYFKIKTPNGVTEIEEMKNKILQGDVLAPMLSSNMVDKNIGLEALKSQNVYMYKNTVVIPPLMMQDDTLGISKCGHKGRQMNNFLNTRSNIMGLQYGKLKCEKMHIGKKRMNKDCCVDFEVDSWSDTPVRNVENVVQLVDTHCGKEKMKVVESKKYLGEIISSDGGNKKNIKEKTDRAIGNVNNIVSSLHERPYGKHTFIAASIMRDAMLLGAMLCNAESWINITEADLTRLQKPDTMLQKELLSASGSPSKAFMSLELGFIPVKYVIMYKRMTFLHYILSESTESMIRKVYTALKSDSRRGDFYHLVVKDMKELEIIFDENKILSYTYIHWKKHIKSKVYDLSLKSLVLENSTKEKTKDIKFSEMKMGEYLKKNRNSQITKIIFSIRSKTLDIKVWNEWKYEDNVCVACNLHEETIEHFLCCRAYENCAQESKWKDILENNPDRQFEIAKIAQKRLKIRQRLLENEVAGLTH